VKNIHITEHGLALSGEHIHKICTPASNNQQVVVEMGRRGLQVGGFGQRNAPSAAEEDELPVAGVVGQAGD
jgi:hypothetical protein